MRSVEGTYLFTFSESEIHSERWRVRGGRSKDTYDVRNQHQGLCKANHDYLS